MSYTIEVGDDGIVIRGPVPIPDLLRIQGLAKDHGFTVVDAGLSTALGATGVITNKRGSQALRRKIEQQNSHLSPLEQWLRGTDTGTSSKTIFYVLTGQSPDDQHRPSTPMDIDDFGRCVRLLDQFPYWRDRLGEVAEKHRQWRPLVREWEHLEVLYRESLTSESYREAFRRGLDSVLKEGRGE